MKKQKILFSSDIDLMEEFELGVILSPARRMELIACLKQLKSMLKI